jgi:hypothetical protein
MTIRRIKEGDMVKAFLEPLVKGKVLQILLEKNDTWLIGGTIEKVRFCLLELDSGKVIKYKLSDLHHI